MARKGHIEFRHLGTDVQPIELMTADILTKPFGPRRFRFLRDRLLGATTTGQDTIEDYAFSTPSYRELPTGVRGCVRMAGKSRLPKFPLKPPQRSITRIEYCLTVATAPKRSF
jgi:hypothetical protein